MRLVVTGVLLGIFAGVAAAAGDLADLAAGGQQRLILPVLVEGRQHYVYMAYGYGRDGEGPVRAVAMAADPDLENLEPGSPGYARVVAEARRLFSSLSGYFDRRIEEAGGPEVGASGTGAANPFGLPSEAGGGTGGTGESAGAGSGDPGGGGLSRYRHRVRRNPDGTLTVWVTMPADRLSRIEMELRTIALRAAASRSTSSGTTLAQGTVETVLDGESGGEDAGGGQVTRWRTFRVTPR